MPCQFRSAMYGLAVVWTAYGVGCKSEPVAPIERGSDTVPINSDAPSPVGGDTETATGGLNNAEACREFLELATDCGASAAYIQEAEAYCTRMEAAFIDSFNESLMLCMSTMTCEELYEMLAQADAGVAPSGSNSDTSTPGTLETCVLNAMLAAQPEQANLDFKQHYCDWAMQCDSSLTAAECDTLFQLSDVAFFMVIEEPHITAADQCVNPMPRCDQEEVTACLETVGSDLGTALGF